MNTKSVQVVMSTYNGEKYLKEQIDSILSQEGVDVRLYIRDDGSSDRTTDILASYQEHKNVKIEKGNNLGFAKSFLTALDECDEADYYAFSDQDDVWEKDKLSTAIEILEEESQSTPLLYCSALQRVDENLNPLHVQSYHGLRINLPSMLTRGRLAGCTFVFNNTLRNLVKNTDVEVVRNFDEIIAMGAFMGKEEPQDSTTYVINPGLGMAAEQGNGFCLDVIEYYKTIHFDFNNIITVCEHVTRCLKKKGYIGNNKIEKIDGFTLYPTEYFCPKNYYTNEMRMTRNTCSIHHYTSSWSSAKFTRFHVFETKIMKIFGPKVSDFFMVKLARNIYCNGLAVTVKKVLRLYKK